MGNDETGTIFNTLLGVFVFCTIITIMVTLFAKARDYDHAVSDDSMRKSSSLYTLAYGTGDYYISAETVLSDMINEEAGVTISVNGSVLNRNYIEKLQANNSGIYERVKSLLGGKRYKKIPVYNQTGDVIEIRYEEEP